MNKKTVQEEFAAAEESSAKQEEVKWLLIYVKK